MTVSASRAKAARVFEQRVGRLLGPGGLPDADLVLLVHAVYSGAHWLSWQAYGRLQQRAQGLQPASPAARQAVSRLRSQGYASYLAAVRTRRNAQALRFAYRQDHIPKTTPKDRRPGGSLQPLYLTIHSTGNPSSKAAGERAWLTNPDNHAAASFHLVVDEVQAVECIPLGEPAWHAGDGRGPGNRKSLSLEICESGNRDKTLRNAAVLAAHLLRERGMDAGALRRHHDWATKLCPRILIVPENRQAPGQTWEWFTAEVDALL